MLPAYGILIIACCVTHFIIRNSFEQILAKTLGTQRKLADPWSLREILKRLGKVIVSDRYTKANPSLFN